jgi:hypothetical protein
MASSPNAPFNRPTSARAGNGQAHRKSSWLLPLALVSCLVAPSQAQAQAQNSNAETGKKGAQIYCFMRSSGNSHQVSWDAAYAVIKRQGDRLFRTSPQHAAVLITESVVENPTEFPDCGRFLGDLFSQPEANSEKTSTGTTGTTRDERYGY